MDKMFDLYEVLSLVLLSSVLYFADACFDLYYVCVLVNMVGYFVFLAVTIVVRIRAKFSKPTLEQIEREVDQEYEKTFNNNYKRNH